MSLVDPVDLIFSGLLTLSTPTKNLLRHLARNVKTPLSNIFSVLVLDLVNELTFRLVVLSTSCITPSSFLTVVVEGFQE